VASTRRATPRWRAATRHPYRTALTIIAITITMASLLVVSYSLALARPVPHHIPAGLVGDAAARPALVARLEAATHGGLAFRRYRSVAEAKRAIDEQRIFAALVLEPPRPRLLIASAAGSSVARVLQTAGLQIAQRTSPRLSVVDLHPLPAGDPEGLVVFYATLAATILGFITVFQLRTNVPGMSRRDWLVCIAVLAVCGGLVITLATDPVIGALRGPFPELWAAFAAQIATAALFTATMLTLVGRWAMLPTWALLVVLGNPSSGGAVAIPLLPAYDRFLGRFMPNAATVETIRNAVYFRDAQHLEPILTQALWLVGTFAALMLATHLRRRTPSAEDVAASRIPRGIAA
jgi:hypothetical protein